MVRIKSPSGFARWARREFGNNWMNHPKVINTYGEEQLNRLYGYEYTSKHETLEKVFSRSDVDYNKVLDRAMPEASAIINGPARDGRTADQILDHSLQGHYAEQYLIENAGYQDYDRKYHDLIKDGVVTEIKTSKSPAYLDRQYDRIKNANWNHSARMIAFLIKGDDYYLYFDKEI